MSITITITQMFAFYQWISDTGWKKKYNQWYHKDAPHPLEDHGLYKLFLQSSDEDLAKV